MTEAIYLDYCATTPLHPEVRQAMQEPLERTFGNPSSLHRHGRQAAELLRTARVQVAAGIGASADEIIFTSGATEANNLALFGVMRAQPPGKRHLITSAIEHHAVLHTAQALASEGFELTILPVDPTGQVQSADLRQALKKETALVSIMMVNNEMGAIQSIAELASIARGHGTLFHTDAVQGVGTLPVQVDLLGVDLLSLSAHKIYGPKGVGALYIRDGVSLEAFVHGGPQELRRRAGTENLPGIVGLGRAMELVTAHKDSEFQRLAALRARFIDRLRQSLPQTVVHGGETGQAPHILSIAFPGVDAELLLFHLDQMGISASMGSACNAEAIEPSHVLLALGLPMDLIGSTLRFSIGLWTEAKHLDHLIDALPELIARSKDR